MRGYRTDAASHRQRQLANRVRRDTSLDLGVFEIRLRGVRFRLDGLQCTAEFQRHIDAQLIIDVQFDAPLDIIAETCQRDAQFARTSPELLEGVWLSVMVFVL